jgi:hypothetical protein
MSAFGVPAQAVIARRAAWSHRPWSIEERQESFIVKD